MPRRDYAHPFRLSGARQAAQATYETHVEQMIRQVLLTGTGERINLPEFGCGLRRLVFEPHASRLDATTAIIVRSALERWLAQHIDVRDVRVLGPQTSGDEARLEVLVEYELRETREARAVQIEVSR
jgi:phage baseplate assembly protein W